MQQSQSFREPVSNDHEATIRQRFTSATYRKIRVLLVRIVMLICSARESFLGFTRLELGLGLLRLLGLRLVHHTPVPHTCSWGYHVPRAMYVLAV